MNDVRLQESTRGGVHEERTHWSAIISVALAARICFALVFFSFSSVPAMEGRGFENVAIALSLRAGHGFSSPFFSDSGPTAFMTPIYPLLLAAVMKMFGTGSAAATIIIVCQEAFSLAIVVIAVYIGRAQFGTRAGNMAGLFCALAPGLLSAPLLTWDACLSIFVLITVFAAASSMRAARLNFIPAGLFCALGGLLNPTLIPTLWALCGWVAWKRRIFPWMGILAFIVGFSPWIVRNAVVMHAFIPLRTNFGYELWQGNHPGSDGDFNDSINPMMSASERQAFLGEGELRYFHKKGELAKAYIQSHPGEFLRLNLKRVWQFWTLWQDRAAASTIPIVLLAIAGFVLAARRRDLLVLYAIPVVVYPMPYYITHVYDRFFWVIEPLLLILSGFALSRFLEPRNGIRASEGPIATQ